MKVEPVTYESDPQAFIEGCLLQGFGKVQVLREDKSGCPHLTWTSRPREGDRDPVTSEIYD